MGWQYHQYFFAKRKKLVREILIMKRVVKKTHTYVTTYAIINIWIYPLMHNA